MVDSYNTTVLTTVTSVSCKQPPQPSCTVCMWRTVTGGCLPAGLSWPDVPLHKHSDTPLKYTTTSSSHTDIHSKIDRITAEKAILRYTKFPIM